MRFLRLCAVLSLLLIPGSLSVAQTPPCGSIIHPAGLYGEDYEENISPITDCGNPFGRTGFLANFLVNGVSVLDNQSVTITDAGISDYGTDDGNENYSVFRHQGADFVAVNTEYLPREEGQIRAAILEYFNDDVALANYYSEIYFAEDNFSYFYVDGDIFNYRLDPRGVEYVFDVFDDLDAYVTANVEPKRNPLLPGTYTVVVISSDDEGGGVSYHGPLEKLFSFLVPRALAATFIDTVTFTLTTETTQLGASSVLFLPGIQASRLYIGDGNQVFNRIWEPTNNVDVRTLALSTEGNSIVDVRTNDIIGEASIGLLGKNIYKDFINFMDDLVDGEVIHEWTPFAYDWRRDVFDLAQNGTKYLNGNIKNPVDEVIRLSDSSLSGKVTIVAHSNGGLLAKAIMLELEERGREELVDKIVFIGTPQLGAVKAIGTILHGYDQEALGGLIIDDGVAREVVRNLPGAYSLLPSEKYLQQTSEPIIYFDNSQTTQPFRSAYGSIIDSYGSLNAFLVGVGDTTSRSAITQDEVSRPILVNQTMYFGAQAQHRELLDNWTAPPGTEVYQIAGTGLPTIKAIEYREITETVCPITAVNILSCPKIKILRPHARFTAYGDETVVDVSAIHSASSAFNKYYLDLPGAAEGIFNLKKNHSNITEASQVQELLNEIIVADNTPAVIDFISTGRPSYDDVFDIEEINSPVQISAKDTQGRVTGVVVENGSLVRKEEIPGSSYTEFGGTKYLIVPSGVERTTTLKGESLGGYTLTLSTLNGNDLQSKKHEIVNATTTPTMIATYVKKDGNYSTVKADYNTDGVVDYESTVDGVYVPPVPVFTYQKLINDINALSIKKAQKETLLVLAREAEKLSLKSGKIRLISIVEKLALKALETAVILYQKNKIISNAQGDNLLKTVRFLIK